MAVGGHFSLYGVFSRQTCFAFIRALNSAFNGLHRRKSFTGHGGSTEEMGFVFQYSFMYMGCEKATYTSPLVGAGSVK